jgi:tryptophan halogenase
LSRRVTVLGDGLLADACAAALTQETTMNVNRAASDVQPSSLDADLVLCALEDVPTQVILSLNRELLTANVPTLFATPDSDGIQVAPPTVPGITACYECERLATLFGHSFDSVTAARVLSSLTVPALDPSTDAAVTQRAGSRAARMAAAALADPPEAQVFTLLHQVGWVDGDSATNLLPHAGCSACPSAQRPVGSTVIERAAVLDVMLATERAAVRSHVVSEPPPDDAYRRVCVLGGGTAGYLTALALRAKLPHLEVSLVESRRIGVIGVGEATTPRLVEFLHLDLGIDVAEFHARVRPAWKLGVHYYWGRRGSYAFPWPFQYGSIAESMTYDGNLHAHCLSAQLMLQMHAPILRLGDGRYRSLLATVPFAYHLDNTRCVAFLQNCADQAGVRRIDRVVIDATVSRDGYVKELITDTGERLAFDFYLDCSGFRSMLLERTLGSPFVPYSTSLFTDAAVVANVPHDGRVKPYTLAESMHNGWCWNIAFEDEDHRGYVFASDFCTTEEAEAEMRARNPGMGDTWSLRFRSGRHEHFLLGNVAALGNAYAFVEPLASTAIHMLLMELDLLTKHFPISPQHTAIAPLLNAHLNSMWDNLRGWLAVQYRFNRKYNTPFWRHCRDGVDLAGAAEYVERFRESAPLSGKAPVPPARTRVSGLMPQYAVDYFGQEYVYDVMLAGQKVPAHYRAPVTSRDEWSRRTATWRRVASWALSHADALQLARERPEMLADIATAAASWSEGMRP